MYKEKTYKILFLASWYPSRIAPTSGNFVQRHAEAVASVCEVHALHICADEILRKKKYDMEISLISQVNTVVVYYKKVKSRIPVFSSLIKFIRYLKAHYLGFKHICEQYGRPQLVHLNITFPAGVVALLWKWLYNIPYVITEHWSIYLPINENKLNTLTKKVSKIIFNCAHYILPVTKNLGDAIKRFKVNTPVEVIPNVVDIHLFFPASQKLKEEKKQLLHISTLDESSKNISGLLSVIAKLSAIRQDFELRIISDGNLTPCLRYAEQLGVFNKFVKVESTKSLPEVAEAMRQADAFVLFSNYESFPCVIGEAMASGIPVVATDVGGINEHLLPEFGTLVKPQDEEGLLQALYNILENTTNYNSQNLHKYAEANFSYEQVAKKFLSVYQRVIK